MAELPHGTAHRVKLSCLFLTAFLAAWPSVGSAALLAEDTRDSLTVSECITLARQRAPEVQARQSELAGARLDSTIAWKNHRPALDLAGGVLVAPEGFYDPVVTNLGEYSTKIEASYPLADGGERRRQRDQALAGLLSTTAERQLAARDAGFRAATIAVDLLKHQELEATNRETLSWLDRLAQLVESSVKGGARPRSDAVRAQLQRDDLESEVLLSAAERDALARELAQLVGRAPGERVYVLEPEAGLELMPTAADSAALAEALQRAPEVSTASAEVAKSRVALAEARSKNAWHVDLAADAGLWGADLTRWVPDDLKQEDPGATFGDRLQRDLGASISLQFKKPLFDPTPGFAVQAEQARLRAAELRQAAALADRRREMFDLLTRWRTAAQRAALARASLERASDNLIRMRSLYAGGAASLLELLDALQQWDDARDRLADARSDARLAHWEGEIRR